jgi:phenylalanyl-tRNA synthetase alpha chain
MPLAEFLAELDELAQQATAAFDAALDGDALEAARIQFLGAKSGRIKEVQKGLGTVEKADKPTAGQRLNATKAAIQQAFDAATQRLAGTASRGLGAEAKSSSGSAIAANASVRSLFDPTVPGVHPKLGHLHPLTQTTEDLKEIMGRLGFTVAEGPEVEDEWHNFEALNIPLDHPARDPLENFYLATAQVVARGEKSSHHGASSDPAQNPGVLLLRSQTSTVQIRVMEKTRPPVRIISVGRVYRPDTADATHYPMFHQIEGLLVDRRVTMADLKSVLRLFAANFFGGDDVHIRFRPSFFPFTEPSVEVDMSWQGGWLEMGGAGMVDPAVLQAVGYDAEEFTGFAFGLGVERICANRHKIADIREFYKNDVRFLHQF